MADRVEIVVADSGLLEGSRAEGGARVISFALGSLGVRPARVTVAAAGPELRGAIGEALSRGSLVVVVDGRGDRERERVAEDVAEAVGVSLGAADEGAGVAFSLPEGALPQASLEGLAPAYSLRVEDREVVVLPGEPSDLEAALEKVLVPALASAEGRKGERLRRLALFGMSREELRDRLEGIPLPEAVSIRVGERFPERLVTLSAGREDGRAELTKAAEAVVGALGKGVVHGLRGETLAQAASDALHAVGATLAVAEGLGGGLLVQRLNAADPFASPLALGVVSSALPSLGRALGAQPAALAGPEAVSAATAKTLAEQVRAVSGARLGLAVCGIGGPTSPDADHPIGLVCFALASARATRTEERRLGPAARWRLEELTAATALSLVLEHCRSVKEET